MKKRKHEEQMSILSQSTVNSDKFSGAKDHIGKMYLKHAMSLPVDEEEDFSEMKTASKEKAR